MFCDRGTPSKNPRQFTIYQAIKDELIASRHAGRGRAVRPRGAQPRQLKALFAQCNRGEVSVLIGSTEKMGTGTFYRWRTDVALCRIDAGSGLCATRSVGVS